MRRGRLSCRTRSPGSSSYLGFFCPPSSGYLSFELRYPDSVQFASTTTTITTPITHQLIPTILGGQLNWRGKRLLRLSVNHGGTAISSFGATKDHQLRTSLAGCHNNRPRPRRGHIAIMAWQPQSQYGSPYPEPSPTSQQPLNGFKEQNLDDDAFGAKGGIVSAFDAFRKPPLRPIFPGT